MALTAILRRSASKVAPLAARVVGAQRQSHCAAFSAVKRAATLSPQLRPAACFSSRNFSSSLAASSDKKLLEIIQSEVDVVAQSEDFGKVVDAPSNFPFTIQDNIGESTVTLSREYQGETITVEVSMPNLITGEEGEEDDEENDEEGGNASSIPLLVTVAKKNGPALEFDVTAFPDEIRINALSLKSPETEDQLAYEGPEFLDLDENLQKAFLKYLEIRGIKPSATNFLHEYMIEKDAREYVRWLKDVKKFVEA